MSKEIVLENPFLQFTLDPQRAAWNLFDRQKAGVALEGVGVGAVYRLAGRRRQALRTWQEA